MKADPSGGNLALPLKTYLWPISVAPLMSGRVPQQRRLCSSEEATELPFRCSAERAVSWAQLLAGPTEPRPPSSGRGPVQRGGDTGPKGCRSRSPRAAPAGRAHVDADPSLTLVGSQGNGSHLSPVASFNSFLRLLTRYPVPVSRRDPEGQWQLNWARSTARRELTASGRGQLTHLRPNFGMLEALQSCPTVSLEKRIT